MSHWVYGLWQCKKKIIKTTLHPITYNNNIDVSEKTFLNFVLWSLFLFLQMRNIYSTFILFIFYLFFSLSSANLTVSKISYFYHKLKIDYLKLCLQQKILLKLFEEHVWTRPSNHATNYDKMLKGDLTKTPVVYLIIEHAPIGNNIFITRRMTL